MKTITLPISKIKIDLNEKITLGMREELDLLTYEFMNGKVDNRAKNIQKGEQLRRRRACLLVIKKAIDPKGDEVEFTDDFLLKLEIEDFLSLESAVDDIYKKKVDFLKAKN